LALKELLSPVDIQVLSEVQVVPDPPRADIILLRRGGDTWTKEQLDSLADGLRDTGAERLLIEFKYTESITDDAFRKLFAYDYLYRESEKLERDQLQSFLVSSKTPNTDILTRYKFEPTQKNGVYVSKMPIFGDMQVILLNELSDKPHNAVLKCFASRKKEKDKAFSTMSHYVLPGRASTKLVWAITGLMRIMMNKTMGNLEVTGWTPDEIVKLGKNWMESKVLAFERQEGRQEGRQEEGASILLLQLEEKFDVLSEQIKEKILNADRSTLEKWSVRFVKAKTLDDIFGL
jgi:hypothetical protein